MYQEKQEVRRREDVIECVPLQLSEEDVDVKCAAEIIEQPRRELENTNVKLEMPAEAVHYHQRRNKRDVSEHFEAESDNSLTKRHGSALGVGRIVQDAP